MISVFQKFKILILFVALALVFEARAQQAILAIETDDTLPIAPMRYDEDVELPKNNFSSSDGKDKWERYENGELDANAYVQLQEEYNSMVETKPDVKRKIASQKKKMMSAEGEIIKGNLLPKKKVIKAKSEGNSRSKPVRSTASKVKPVKNNLKETGKSKDKTGLKSLKKK